MLRSRRWWTGGMEALAGEVAGEVVGELVENLVKTLLEILLFIDNYSRRSRRADRSTVAHRIVAILCLAKRGQKRACTV